MWRLQGNFWELVLPSTLLVSRIPLRLSGVAAGAFSCWVILLALGSLWSLREDFGQLIDCFLASPEVFPRGFPLAGNIQVYSCL